MAITITGLTVAGSGGRVNRLLPTFTDSITGNFELPQPFDLYAATVNNRAGASYIGSGTSYVDHTGIAGGSTWYYWATMDSGATWFPVSPGVGLAVTAVVFGTIDLVSGVAASITNSGGGNAYEITNSGGGNALALNNTGGGHAINFSSSGGSAAIGGSASGGGAGFDLSHSGGGDGFTFSRSSGGGLYGYKATMSAGAFCFYASVGGSVGKYGPFTGAHDGLLKKQAHIEPGDVVYDVRVYSRGGVSDTLTEIARSTEPCQKGIVGVYVGRRRIRFTQALLGENGITRKVRQEFDLAVFNGLGQGQINICMENGPIKKGDLLVSSSRPGKAMRQDDDTVRSYTVARAREDADSDSQIACIYSCG